MKRALGTLILLCVLIGAVVGCGATPEPTAPPPTLTGEVKVPTPVPTAPPPTPTQGGQAPTPAPTKVPPTPTQEGEILTPTEPATPSQEATATPTPTPVSSKPTNTPTSAALKYPPPTLLRPPNEVPISWKYSILLEWSSVGELAKDEYYHLHLDAYREVNGEWWYGDYVYTKDTSYRAEGAFLAPFHPSQEKGRAVVHWWIQVVRKTGEDQSGKPLGIDLSPRSEERTFITEPKPSGP